MAAERGQAISKHLRESIAALDFARSNGRVRTADLVGTDDSRASRNRARRRLTALVDAGLLLRRGMGNAVHYVPAEPNRTRTEPSEAELLALVIGGQTQSFLRGSDVTRWYDQLLNRTMDDAGPGVQARARLFEQRFRVLMEPARRFEGTAEIVDDVVSALRSTRLVRFVAPGLSYERFEPLGLVLYRRGLYLLGRAIGEEDIQRIPIDRVTQLTKLRAGFEYPADFDLDAELRPWFGIRKGPPIEPVELRFKGRVAHYVLARLWHASARDEEQLDGSVILRMEVGGEELVRWALEWGETVEVVRPAWLRAAVIAELRGALAQYTPRPSPMPKTSDDPVP